MNYDSIIVGAGLSGLTCGLLLAKSGRRVLLVEQHPEPAPVVRGFKRQGLYFDSGFHYAGGAGEDGPLSLLLRHLGLLDKLKLFPFSGDGFDQLRILATGENLLVPVGINHIRANLVTQFPEWKQEIETLLSEIEQCWRNFLYLDVEKNVSDFGLQTVHEQSLAQRLSVFADVPLLQSLFSMHSLLYGVAPHAAPVSLNSQVSGSYFHSVHGIEGGGRSLAEAFVARFRALGGVLQCQADVEQIVVADGKVQGVRLTTQEIIRAAEVIVTCNPALLPAMLPTGILRPAYKKRLQALNQTPSALILYACSRASAALLQHRNLFLFPQSGVVDPALDHPLEERPMYLAAADQGPDSKTQGVIAIVPADFSEVAIWSDVSERRSQAYRDWKKRISERLCRHIRINCPELSDLRAVDLATPLTLRDYSRAPQGAIYGVGRVVGQHNPQPATRLPGLFLSGQAVAGPGLLGTLAAGYYTCGTILGHESLREELRVCR